jgi:putative Ca2+/H+ antiporter (TMEM165/GDT1 family)
MSGTIIKLRICGIAAFLFFMLSALFGSQARSNFYFTQIQQILILISFVIFALLILLQAYGFYFHSRVKEEDDGQ